MEGLGREGKGFSGGLVGGWGREPEGLPGKLSFTRIIPKGMAGGLVIGG